jgi:tripeptide aminopeptidase
MTDARLTEIFLALAGLDGQSGKEKPVADYLVSFLKELGLAPRVDDTAAMTGSNTGNVICEIAGGGDLVLLAHQDTARRTSGTKHIVTGDRISSDGRSQLGADNRAGIAVILHNIERAVKESLPVRPFTAVFTVMEETTMGGSLNLRLNRKIKYGFVFDSSSDPGVFAVSSPGAAAFTVEVRGRPSHAGIAPEKGICAVSIAAKALASLTFGRLDEETTSNIGTISGGEAVNVVPPSCRVTGEVRSLDVSKVPPVLETIKKEFETAAAQKGGAAEFSWVWDFKPYRHSEKSEVCLMAIRAVKDAGLEPVPARSHGGSDANSLNANGVATVNFGIGAKNPHADDEYILLEHLRQSGEIVRQLIKK